MDRRGTFVYRGGGSVSIYVDGYTGSSVNQEAKEGTWRIYRRGNQAILELLPTGEKSIQFALADQGGKTFLNGTRYFVTDP